MEQWQTAHCALGIATRYKITRSAIAIQNKHIVFSGLKGAPYCQLYNLVKKYKSLWLSLIEFIVNYITIDVKAHSPVELNLTLRCITAAVWQKSHVWRARVSLSLYWVQTHIWFLALPKESRACTARAKFGAQAGIFDILTTVLRWFSVSKVSTWTRQHCCDNINLPWK